MATSKLTTKQQVESIWDLGGLIPLRLIKNVWKLIDEDNVLGLAAYGPLQFGATWPGPPVRRSLPQTQI